MPTTSYEVLSQGAQVQLADPPHPTARYIKPDDVQAYTEQISGLGPDGELLPELREALGKMFDEMGLKKPASWTT